jgi:hypothetical protein
LKIDFVRQRTESAGVSTYPARPLPRKERELDMKRFLLATVLAAAIVPAFAADVGVSISVGEPGFYGRLDLGNAPQPRLIYAEPIVVQRQRVDVVREPVYLHVPPGHERNWRKHCRQYNACGQPVYFVQNNWYDEVYVPHHQNRLRDGHRGDRADSREDRHDNDDGRRRDGNRGKGNRDD